MSPLVEARVVELRWAYPGCGPRTIAHRLAREGVVPVPGLSSVYRCLRHDLITPQARRRRRADYKRWERARSMELWQMDVVGGLRLRDGREAKLVTGIDDHSRFCVCAFVVARATAKPVCDALALVGTIELAVPKLRTGSYFPSWLLEPRAVIAAATGQGCRLDGSTNSSSSSALNGISKSQVSALAKSLDEAVEAWRNRPLKHLPLHLSVAGRGDPEVREGDRVVNVAVVHAVGVRTGRRRSPASSPAQSHSASIRLRAQAPGPGVMHGHDPG